MTGDLRFIPSARRSLKHGVRVAAALLVSVMMLAGTQGMAFADTQYYGGIEGKTYLNNWNGQYSQGVWGSTWVSNWSSHNIREELHPQDYIQTCVVGSMVPGVCLIPPGPTGYWWDRDTRVVDQYANYVSTDDYLQYSAMRGWSWHKDWDTGDEGTTSDGY